MAAPYTSDIGMMRGNKRVLIGVGVSIAVHMMLMFAYRHGGPALPISEAEPPSSIMVRILPPPPPPPTPAVETAPRAPAQAAAPRSARRSVPRPVIAVPAAPQQDTPADAFSVEQAPPEATPTFDMNAARGTARELAGRTKLGIEGTAHAQFPDPPLETETKAARAISRAKRPNCKDGLPGGLLAPLFLMMDKKDHGCKW